MVLGANISSKTDVYFFDSELDTLRGNSDVGSGTEIDTSTDAKTFDSSNHRHSYFFETRYALL